MLCIFLASMALLAFATFSFGFLTLALFLAALSFCLIALLALLTLATLAFFLTMLDIFLVTLLALLTLATLAFFFAMLGIFLITLLAVLFGCLFLAGLITELSESLHDLLFIGLIGIVLNGNCLLIDIGLHALDTFLKAQVALNLVLTTLTVHLRHGSQNNSLNVFCKGDACYEEHRQHHHTLFHLS